VSCSEDGEVRVWDLTRGLLLANAFWASGAVAGALVVKRDPGELARGGGERFRLHDAAAWTRVRELAEAGQLLRAEEEETATSVELIKMNTGVYRRCLWLLLRETTAVASAKDGSGGSD
jgi:pre-rRNA-processing protein IPI3